MTKFYVCKFCNKKVHYSYLAQHSLRQHLERLYTIVEFETQTVFELKNEGGTILKIEKTEIEENKKWGFNT